MQIGLSRPQQGGGELRMIWRIGEMLGFEANRLVLPVGNAPVPFQTAVEKIGGVNLDARLAAIQAKPSSAFRMIKHRRRIIKAVPAIQHKAIVQGPPDFVHWAWPGPVIEWRTLHRNHF